jgi:tetratricopeptide (TPR) repeat protein
MRVVAGLYLLSSLLSAQPPSTAKLLHEAEEKIALEQMDLAEGLLKDVVRQDPTNTDALYRLAYVQYRGRKLAPARTNFAAIVKLAPPAYNSRYFLGRIALLEDKPKEAIQWLEPVVAAGASSFDAASQLAKAYSSAGEARKALGPLRTAIGQTPWDGSLYYRLGQVYQKTGEPELAREAFQNSSRLKSATAADVEIMLRTSQFLASGKLAEARELSAQILQRSVVEPGTLVALGVVYVNANLTAEALQAFERAAALDPGLYQAQFNYGLALLKANRALDALAPLHRAFDLLPQSQEAATTLGLALVMGQQYSEAIAPLEVARKREPGNARLGALTATALLRSGEPAKAVSVLRETSGRDSNDPAAQLLLVEALDGAGQTESALEEALRCRQRFPGLVQSHMAAAQQLVKAGRYEDAGAAFEQVLKLSPGQAEAQLGLADSLQKSGRHQEALERYLAAGPSLPSSLGQSRSLIALKQLEDARRVLEAAVRDYPAEVTLRLELSRVYARLGEPALASEQVKMIEQLRAR